MSNRTAHIPSALPASRFPMPTSGKHLSWAEFQKRYLSREDGYKYEWLNGTVEKTLRSMDFTQFYILFNLTNLLDRLKSQGKLDGMLISEGDIFFFGNHRRPDIAYLSRQQIAEAGLGKNPEPKFLIEVISTHDGINKVQKKMDNYRAAGVEVVWLIFPLLQQVHVYRGKKSVICTGQDLCSAAPVLPDFVLTVDEVFQNDAATSAEGPAAGKPTGLA